MSATSEPLGEEPRGAERFFVETWGCQMNELDSQRMAGSLMQAGLLPTNDVREADVVLLNSCSVREKAAQKAYSRLGEYRLLKRGRPNLRIGFCGCVAQQEGERALKRIPDLDFVVGTGRVGELGDVLERSRLGERVLAVGFPEDRPYEIDAISREFSYKGMVTIVEGCNKRCTFCIVPTTRGPERSRPLRAIVEEVEHLLSLGFVEIELLGQTVNHWREPGGEDLDFADLLHRVAELPGLERLRYVTSYPRDFTPRMVETFAQHENICPYLHLPVQSGSNRVLRRMGRGYEIELYDRLVADLRQARPDLNLSTDLIVGFPGESDADFQATVDLVRRTEFGSIYAFKYSPRPGTPALRLADDEVAEDVASERLQELFATQAPIQRRLNERLVGQTLAALVTGPSKRPGVLTARTACHRLVHFEGTLGNGLRSGRLTQVEIASANDHSLMGRLVSLPESGAAAPRVEQSSGPSALTPLGVSGS